MTDSEYELEIYHLADQFDQRDETLDSLEGSNTSYAFKKKRSDLEAFLERHEDFNYNTEEIGNSENSEMGDSEGPEMVSPFKTGVSGSSYEIKGDNVEVDVVSYKGGPFYTEVEVSSDSFGGLTENDRALLEYSDQIHPPSWTESAREFIGGFGNSMSSLLSRGT